MQKRRTVTIVSLLVILLLGFGNSLAENLGCLPDCPDCTVLPECCSRMDHDSGSGRGSTGHQPVPGACSHGEMCHDTARQLDFAPVNSFGFDYPGPCISGKYTTQVQPLPDSKNYLPVVQRPPAIRPPSLFLMICSFLI